ncbi:MAG: aldo/keto reductase [Acidobacteria bacterium]|mgnify:CR=1 FL=1|nr:MAG: aldo/keto reductase [Acidobacteriota bacterium]REK04002.1 MAG: aldo/keto reductase [Acidobacteriota bacterium]REK15164.1 MAG: aldo/keto reductase [Acidobacteriota bacterium]REK46254.1 MAG: aldo/keto reductase [Acidobacteriota bacterium]
MKSGVATGAGTGKFAARYANAEGFYRDVNGIKLASVGIGTYLGNWDDETDVRYKDTVSAYVRKGGNVIDTAANYRFQRSERSIGNALKELSGEFGRDEIFVSTKGGYLPFDSEPESDVGKYFEEEFVSKGIAARDDLVGGSHCIAPDYLESQVEQSLRNLGIDSVDLFYIHNPEAQLGAVDRYTFEARMASAFEKLEELRDEKKIGSYGAATWNGFRVSPDDQGYHSLEGFVRTASQVGGDEHGFRYVQLPHNLAMPEAYLVPNQSAKGRAVSLLQAAEDLGITVMASASILQGQLSKGVPMHVRGVLGNPTTDAMTSIQFVRSTPGITTALVGMSSLAHVEENMSLVSVPPTPEQRFAELFTKDA